MEWFRNRAEAGVQIEQWRRDYNQVGPPSSISYLTPAVFRRQNQQTLTPGPKTRGKPLTTSIPSQSRYGFVKCLRRFASEHSV